MSSPNWWGDWRPTLTPHTGNLLATDLIECTMIVGGLPVNTVITGAQILGAVPSGGGLDVGTSPITSGTVGRILFQGTGNVLQQSANLFWDNTNSRLGIGTSSPTAPVNIVGGTETFAGYQRSLWLKTSTNAKSSVELILENTFTTTGRMYEIASYSDGSFNITDRTNSGLRFKIDNTYVQFHSSAAANANLIGTVANINALWFNQTSATATTSNYTLCNVSGLTLLNAPTGGSIYFRIGNSNKALLTNGGNLLLNTTTDAGYKLDVNGSSRASSLVINGTAALFNSGISVFQNSTNRAFSVSASVTKSNGAERILFSLNSSELTNQQAMDFGYIGASALTNRYFYLQSSESGVGYGGGVVLQHNGGWASVGSSSYIASAVFHVASTNRGFLPPRMTNAQMLAIATPAAGLVVYDTTNNKHCGYNGTAWQNFY